MLGVSPFSEGLQEKRRHVVPHALEAVAAALRRAGLHLAMAILAVTVATLVAGLIPALVGPAPFAITSTTLAGATLACWTLSVRCPATCSCRLRSGARSP